MAAPYVRICPTCATENAPEIMRCKCGALLAGVDMVQPAAAAVAEASRAMSPPVSVGAGRTLPCPFEDCGQPNPADAATCVYCNRLLADNTLTPPDQPKSLLNLPARLKASYRVVKPLPVAGAEAELLLVEPLVGGSSLILKLYRHGILPRKEVQERVAKASTRHRVEIMEAGIEEGYAYELMEFCPHGSLRDVLRGGPMQGGLLMETVRELTDALTAIHAVGILHRDLKPENILVRSLQPLNLVLTDFGIASVLDATQRFTGEARTLPYASPESLSGIIDRKADYWALGMILLEAALGKHPFDGLSEAVILHQLATRSIDLSELADRNLRKLIRGLLLRDPEKRWSDREISRWLAGDGSLEEPAEQSPGTGFVEPYRIAADLCTTPAQLAVALTRNWAAGVTDMNNGQLLKWFRDVQKDQNLVRLLLELQHGQNVHVDVRLLKLILHLAPGIPPVWRGESIELPAILKQANLALKGSAEALLWLDTLYQYRVLEAYAETGNAVIADLVERWSNACDRFNQAWTERLAFLKKRTVANPDEVANFDDIVYGKAGPQQPSLRSLHPRLLAIAYDAAWSERLRKRLLAELSGLTAQCPWLAEVGNPQEMDAASLLVLESLLPEARKAAENQIKAADRKRQEAINEHQSLKAEVERAIASIAETSRNRKATPAVCDELRQDLENFFSLLEQARRSGRSDDEWASLKRRLLHFEPVAHRLSDLISKLEEQRAANAGWLSARVIGFFALAFLVLPLLTEIALAYGVLAAITGIMIVWRLWPTHHLMKQVKELGGTIASGRL